MDDDWRYDRGDYPNAEQERWFWVGLIVGAILTLSAGLLTVGVLGL